ncbi:NAD(P)/FAD-dependent oxidoreductase [Croceibacterium ferulae]|uniref:NAD(P)/FAD-dependent oxidoreductase n=1 Tax=Croceibacterium ferulae TaxID=1854641 RepID=UPI001F4EBEA5|nr:FAD-binding oxidoreductase [Croceibacterium ferulae]
MSRIVVVGAGIVGLCSALHLLERGCAVTVIDNDPAGQAASWGNAGHIATEQVEPLASPAMLRSAPGRLFMRGGALALPPRALRSWLPFALRLVAASRPASFAAGRDALAALLHHALPAWEDVLQKAGTPDLLRQDGHFVLWQDAAAAEAGQAHWVNAATGTASVHPAHGDELARLTALCSVPVAGAIRFDGTAQIADLAGLRAALREAVIARGGRLVDGTATLQIRRGRAEVDGMADHAVLVCAGVRSAALMRQAGHRVPIIAERGYHIRSTDHDWPDDMPPVVFEQRSLIVTRYRTALQAASFVELQQPDAPADPRKWARLERHVGELGLPMRGPFRRWIGSRPTFPDYLPAIGRSTRVGNLHYAFGHQHLGLTLAPVTARAVAAMMVGEQPDLSLAPFDLERFA